jgi:hypothetical protein
VCPVMRESQCKPDPGDEWKPRNRCDLGWQFRLEKNQRRLHVQVRIEKSGKREMMGVTPRSPPAAIDSLTRQSVYPERHDAIDRDTKKLMKMSLALGLRSLRICE